MPTMPFTKITTKRQVTIPGQSFFTKYPASLIADQKNGSDIYTLRRVGARHFYFPLTICASFLYKFPKTR